MIDVNSKLRLRRGLLGYRRGDVEIALAEMRLTLRWLQRQLEVARNHVRQVDSELATVQAELEAARAREREIAEAMSSARRRAAEIEEAAEARAQAIVAASERQAARHAEEAWVRLDELLSLEDGLVRTLRGAARDVDSVVGRIERGEPAAGQAPPTSPPPGAPSPAAAPPPLPPIPELEPEIRVFDARVELDAGPFSDYAALSAFESALGRLPRVEDVYIRRYAGDRALLELTMSEPGPLLQALRESLPHAVSVESADHDRVSLTVRAP